MESVLKGKLTLLDYLKLEEDFEVKHEFFNGNLIEMPGATIFHERVIKNLFLFLSKFEIQKQLELFFSGMKLLIPDKELVFYPDLMIGLKDGKDIRYLRDAVLVTEVLSPATRSYDQADKFIAYRTLPSLMYYLLIEPEYYHVTLYFKDDAGYWQSDTFRKLDQQISLPALEMAIPLAAIYEGLIWD